MKYLTLRRQDEEDVCLRLGEAPGGRAPLQGVELERRADGARGLCEDLRDLRRGACAGGARSAGGRACAFSMTRLCRAKEDQYAPVTRAISEEDLVAPEEDVERGPTLEDKRRMLD